MSLEELTYLFCSLQSIHDRHRVVKENHLVHFVLLIGFDLFNPFLYLCQGCKSTQDKVWWDWVVFQYARQNLHVHIAVIYDEHLCQSFSLIQCSHDILNQILLRCNLITILRLPLVPVLKHIIKVWSIDFFRLWEVFTLKYSPSSIGSLFLFFLHWRSIIYTQLNRWIELDVSFMVALSLAYLHIETERASLAMTCRLSEDLTSSAFDNPLDDSQTKTDPVTIHLRSPVQLSKPGKQFWQVFFTDSYTSVVHLNHEILPFRVVAS